ncbi:helix-turn-helix domain-containing protein [Nocardiopsis aegyptia]|uniref:helix-turn-helix domain-containing protein n=1 Tax=Nocardiopsis aegyptia TaxID=220378 RepID=UPI00366D4A17
MNRRFDHEGLRRLREDHGVSVRDLAKTTGLSKSALEKLEQGLRTKPHPATYKKIREAFDLQPGALFIDDNADAHANA